jgi:hypothetical protein
MLNVWCLLDQQIKQLAQREGSAPVESKREFVQIIVQVRVRHFPIMHTQQTALQEQSHSVSRRYKILSHDRGLGHHLVLIALGFPVSISTSSLAKHLTAWLDAPDDFLARQHSGGLVDTLKPNAPDLCPIILCRDQYQGFKGCASSPKPWRFSRQVAFVRFHRSRQPIPPRMHHALSQLVQPSQSCLVASSSPTTHPPERFRSILLTVHLPEVSKPQRNIIASFFDDGARCYRKTIPKSFLFPQYVFHPLGLNSITALINKSRFTQQVEQILPTRLLFQKSLLQFY